MYYYEITKKAKYFLEILTIFIHICTQKWRNRSNISTYTTHFWLHEKIPPKPLSAESGKSAVISNDWLLDDFP